MRPSEIIKEVDNLDLSDKLLLVEDIWDLIARNNDELPLPQWQIAELERRCIEYESGMMQLHESNGVHEELRNRYK